MKRGRAISLITTSLLLAVAMLALLVTSIWTSAPAEAAPIVESLSNEPDQVAPLDPFPQIGSSIFDVAHETVPNQPGFAKVSATQAFTVWYDFETGLEGWRINPYSFAITNVKQSCIYTHRGLCSMEIQLNLRDQANYNSGEVYVTFPARDLSGQTLIAWVYAPKGARGHPSLSNGLHLFAQDVTGTQLYGTWHNMWEEGWFQIALPITRTTPACGSRDLNFDPTRVNRIGVNIGAGSGAGISATYTGSIFIDTISVGMPDPLQADHLYDFADANDLKRIPRWEVDPTWEADAWNELSIQNGALVATATFEIGPNPADDSGRKGFMSIIYSPYLNLAHKDHHIVSLDVRFNPTAVQPRPNHCPFVISIRVWDDHKQKWYWSDAQHVGIDEWTNVSFDLDNPAEFAPGSRTYTDDMPTLSDIRRVGVQLYANVPYSGVVMFDNIVVGGKENPNQYPSQNQGFVQRQGTQFVLNGKPFRFLGVNAEYLFTLREEEAAAVLDAAQRMGATVVRTWGFSEGCESADANCVAYSRYFQPERGVWNETAFENFDRVVAMAGARGLRLIVPLVNNWDEYGGIPQYVEWLAEEHPDQIVIPPGVLTGTQLYTDTLHDLFFTNDYTRLWYSTYVTAFISRTNRVTDTRYEDDPTIFSWEVVNEARAKSDVSGAKIHGWLKDMSDHIRSIDQNHLIGSGSEGWYIKSQSDTVPYEAWQTLPKNYWHYGVNWSPSCTIEENWGSNGSDFLSIHSSVTRTVRWQEFVGPNYCCSGVQSAARPGLPNIDYTSVHLYVAESESNLYRAPYCDWGYTGTLCNLYDHDYFQAREWIAQHVRDSHVELGKPFIVGEFGLRKSETYQGSPGAATQYVPAYTPDERRQLYTRYSQMMCEEGVNGALVWNLGYDRFNDVFWDGVESLDNWTSQSVSLTLSSDPQTASWGSKSIKVDYNPQQSYDKVAIDRVNINENWKSSYRTKIEIDLYNTAGITQVVLGLVTGPSEKHYESVAFTVTTGWNTIVANAELPYWRCTSPGCSAGSAVENLDDVRKLSIVLYGYGGSGSAYIDHVRHQGNDSLVIYPNEPLFETIVFEARRWPNNCPRVFLPIVSSFKGIVLDDFETGISDWFPALRNVGGWGPDEAAIDVRRVFDAAIGSWVMQGIFDFGLTAGPDPRATYFRANLPIQDWSPFKYLQFKAKSLVSPSYNLRVFIALATGDSSCWNELGDFRPVGSDYQTFTYDLDRPLYKTCEYKIDYIKPLIGKEKVVRLHLIFIADGKPIGAVVIDDVRLLQP